MKTLICLLFAASALAEAANTVTKTTSSSVQAVAGAISCTFNVTSASPMVIQKTCTYGGITNSAVIQLPQAVPSAWTESISLASDRATWIFSLPATGSITYDITVNGQEFTGAF